MKMSQRSWTASRREGLHLGIDKNMEKSYFRAQGLRAEITRIMEHQMEHGNWVDIGVLGRGVCDLKAALGYGVLYLEKDY